MAFLGGDDVTVLASLKLSAEQMRAELERVKQVSAETGLSMDKAVRATTALQSAHAKAAVEAHKLAQGQGALATQTGQIAVVWNQAMGLWRQSIGIASQLVGAWVDLAQEGARLEDLYGSLEISIRGAALATKGYVSDQNLAAAAARLTVAGLQFSEGEYTKFTEIVAKLADAQGKDIPEALERATDAIAKNAERGLKEVGLLVDRKAALESYAQAHGLVATKLNEAQERQALWNAALERGTAATKTLALNTGGVGEAMERVGVAWDNLRGDIAQGLNMPGAMSTDVAFLIGLEGMLVRIRSLSGRAAPGGGTGRPLGIAGSAELVAGARQQEMIDRFMEEERLASQGGAKSQPRDRTTGAAIGAEDFAAIGEREARDRAAVREAELEQLMATAGGVAPGISDAAIEARATQIEQAQAYSEALEFQLSLTDRLAAAEAQQLQQRSAGMQMAADATRAFVSLTAASVAQAIVGGKSIAGAFKGALEAFGDFLITRGAGWLADAAVMAFVPGFQGNASATATAALAEIAIGGSIKAGAGALPGGGGGGGAVGGGGGAGGGPSPTRIAPPGGSIEAAGPPQALPPGQLGTSSSGLSVTINFNGIVTDAVATGRQVAGVLEEMMRADGGPRNFPRGRSW